MENILPFQTAKARFPQKNKQNPFAPDQISRSGRDRIR